MERAIEYSEEIGCRLLVLNAKESSIDFYKKLDFKMLKQQDTRIEKTMYLVMPKENSVDLSSSVTLVKGHYKN